MLNWQKIKVIFGSTKGGFNHHRLIRQGAAFTASFALFLLGLIISFANYKIKAYRNSQIDTFASEQAFQFSKTGTEVDADTPFKLKNNKTVYVPLKFPTSSMLSSSGIESDMSKYHIFVAPSSGRLKYNLRSVRLISFGTSGNVVMECRSGDPIQSQILHMYVYYTTKYSNAKSDDVDTSTQSKFAASLGSMYDMFDFTINLGATSMKTATSKYIYNPKTVNLGILDEIRIQKHMKKFSADETDTYNDIKLDINRLNKQHALLKEMGYSVKDIPSWAKTPDNNLSKTLPVTYKSLTTGNLLDGTWLTSGYNDNVETKFESMIIGGPDLATESKDVDSVQDSRILNKDDGTVAYGSNYAGDANSKKENANASSVYQEYGQILSGIYSEKKSLYLTQPIKLWNYYQKQRDAANISDSNLSENKITYSNISGHDSVAKYLIIRQNALNQ